ncbi:hypothetical protein Salat_2658600 [Sesamum alatum]|uniref:Uncharacterized protein n=1 Tax=Sesamum alatum TaxID=300844 RepID=A0AAE1XQ29_9LAMI|nr:hypothetical protein Salat_2658600 [Sesamum alatum]
MKESSKAIMGAALLMAITLSIVLTLLLLLLAELYCSLLLRRRRRHDDHHPKTADLPTPVAATSADGSSLSSFYAQGVLRAPRSFLFPTTENHLPISSTHHSSALYSTHNPWPAQEAASPPLSATTSQEQLVYICNPIYDGEEAMIRVMSKEHDDTPFETPGTSPSRLEIMSTLSSTPSSPTTATTPPLTPMKKLPAEGSSVSLRDARSICTTPSESNNTNNDGISSSSSGSPCTSPSW